MGEKISLPVKKSANVATLDPEVYLSMVTWYWVAAYTFRWKLCFALQVTKVPTGSISCIYIICLDLVYICEKTLISEFYLR